MDVSNVAINIQ